MPSSIQDPAMMPMKSFPAAAKRGAGLAALALMSTLLLLGLPHTGAAPAVPEDLPQDAAGIRFEVGFASSARPEPVTGRVYVAISREQGRGPIFASGRTGTPLYAVNVTDLAPGETATIDGSAFGHPVQSLSDIPAGEYWVQAFVNVYTKFDRADGHTVWLHMDQWEGQRWQRSPGNMFSEPVQIRLDPDRDGTIRLMCDQVIPPIEARADTEYVKRFRIQSRILSAWWGHPIYVGATVLLPKDYGGHPDVRYPVNYIQGHFSTGAPNGFGRGGDFDEWWLAEDTPRFIYVTLQHPSPYYDDSYGVNSENNGPYGDAIMEELIPEVERRFRIIREPWARQLSGGSTGGWIALALQIFHPDFFGATWASCPDAIDFRYHQIVNIYEDANAYFVEHDWTSVERPNHRQPDGNIVSMMKDENWFELVQGDRSRSGGQWDIWEATYSPVGPDGYPKRIWDKLTGEIDHDVAAYWKEHYDLRDILERNWEVLGPRLQGKIHIYTGDMDSYYLNDATHLMADFLESTTDPHYDGEVIFQPLAPHCWGPRGAELMEKMVDHIERYAPEGADLRSWRHR